MEEGLAEGTHNLKISLNMGPKPASMRDRPLGTKDFRDPKKTLHLYENYIRAKQNHEAGLALLKSMKAQLLELQNESWEPKHQSEK